MQERALNILVGQQKQCICKYPNAQFTITGNGPPISSNGTITGSGKSHFRYCVYRLFFLFSGLGASSLFSHEQRERDATRSLKS